MEAWDRVDRVLERTEQALVVVFLSTMMILAFLQIFLRNVLTTGLAWGDLLLRNLVLWIGFIGASLATREGKHINIDILSRSLPVPWKTWVECVTQLFAALICGLLTYAALKFVKMEVQMGSLPLLGIPVWTLETILPLTFCLMAARFISGSMRSLMSLFRPRFHPREKEEE